MRRPHGTPVPICTSKLSVYTFKSLPAASRIARRDFPAGTAATSIIASHPFSACPIADQEHICIMETTDRHRHVYPRDHQADKPAETVRPARAAMPIRHVRRQAANPTLIDNAIFSMLLLSQIISPASAK